MRIIESPQAVQLSKDGAAHAATVVWQLTSDHRYAVSIECAEFDTFEPVDPVTVTTVAEQQADVERQHGASMRATR